MFSPTDSWTHTHPVFLPLPDIFVLWSAVSSFFYCLWLQCFHVACSDWFSKCLLAGVGCFCSLCNFRFQHHLAWEFSSDWGHSVFFVCTRCVHNPPPPATRNWLSIKIGSNAQSALEDSCHDICMAGAWLNTPLSATCFFILHIKASNWNMCEINTAFMYWKLLFYGRVT